VSGLYFGGSLLAATVAGALALFAPCCISVMLPAYFASSFHNVRRLVAMTFVFAAGIATVILPITLGAAFLIGLINSNHVLVYAAGGTVMLGLAAYTLQGGTFNLPSPGRPAGSAAGPVAVYSLGLFSGVASSCCAPVLAGIIALSGISGSLGLALSLGSAYVLGMVLPLFLIAVLWDARDWRDSRLFHRRSLSWGVGGFRRTITDTQLLSGLLLAVMGAATIWVGFAGRGMVGGGWAASFTVALQGYGRAVTTALGALPNWLVGLILVVATALLAWRALIEVGWLGRRHGSADA
jgi:cytochrome c biogenesis protein CcdA